MTNPPQRPFWMGGFTYRSNLGLILALIAVVLLVAWLRPDFGRPPVYLDVDTPDFIFIGENDEYVPVEINLRLVNTTDEPVELRALNSCYVFRWLVLDESQSMAQTHTLEQCGSNEMIDVLEPNSTLVSQTRLAFNPARMPPGHRYKLIVRYWGYEAETTIRARVAQDDS